MAERRQYLMITAAFPYHKRAEVGAKKEELDKKFPVNALGTKVITSVILPAREGVKSIFIADPPEEKFLDYYEHITNRQMEFSSVEGYVFKTEICSKINFPFE